jgi:hypothetical protein
MRSLLVAALLTAVVTPHASGHGGGLDKNGCHTNRKTGEYHCHGGLSASPAPARSAAPQRVSSTVVVNAAPTTGEKDLTRAAQVLLRALGYQPSLLGNLDERTRAAVRAFQRAENLDADGLVSEYLVLRLAERVTAKCH